jgi:hypothetical protein
LSVQVLYLGRADVSVAKGGAPRKHEMLLIFVEIVEN